MIRRSVSWCAVPGLGNNTRPCSGWLRGGQTDELVVQGGLTNEGVAALCPRCHVPKSRNLGWSFLHSGLGTRSLYRVGCASNTVYSVEYTVDILGIASGPSGSLNSLLVTGISHMAPGQPESQSSPSSAVPSPARRRLPPSCETAWPKSLCCHPWSGIGRLLAGACSCADAQASTSAVFRGIRPGLGIRVAHFTTQAQKQSSQQSSRADGR